MDVHLIEDRRVTLMIGDDVKVFIEVDDESPTGLCAGMVQIKMEGGEVVPPHNEPTAGKRRLEEIVPGEFLVWRGE